MQSNGASISFGVTEDSFADSLRRRAEEKQAEHLRLLHEQGRIALQLERCSAYIEHLNGLLEVEGLPRIHLRQATDRTGFARPGNRSKDMPLRKAQWEGQSLQDAIEQILDSSLEIMHADVLAHDIYEIENQADRRKAKRTLVSTLRQGAKAGRWRTIPGNRYQSLRAKLGMLVGATEGGDG